MTPPLPPPTAQAATALRERVGGRLRRPSWAVHLGVLLVLSAVVRLAYGPGAVGYDASWAALWGEQLASGMLPDYEAPLAPTPHPLTNLVAAALSVLGDDAALTAGLLLSALAFAGLAWAGCLLGARLVSPAVGLGFAVLLLTRPSLVNVVLQAPVDVPFAALVMAAAAVAVRREHRPWSVLVLLGLAGLLRPEAWPLAVLYAAVAWRAGIVVPGRAVLFAALAVAAPVLWALSDLVVTGDPLHSLNGTRELADALERSSGLGDALGSTPGGLADVVGSVVALIGLAGVVAAAAVLPPRTLAPAAVGGLGLLGYLVLGVTGLPLLSRYLLVPALVLALFCAVACGGWALLDATHPARRAWQVLGTLAAVAVAVSLAGDLRRAGNVRAFNDERRVVEDDLRAVTRAAPVLAALRACEGLSAPAPLPLLALWLDRPPGSVVFDPAGDRPGGVVLGYARPEVAPLVSLTPPEVFPATPPGSQVVLANRSWTVRTTC